MAIYGANKSNSAAQVVQALARDCKSVVVKERGIKKLSYKNYAIHVLPCLVVGKTPSCIIGLNNVGICHKLGVPAAKEWIDADIYAKQPKLRCKVKKIVPVVLDCPHCSGSGMNRFDKLCKYCKGSGVK